MVRSYERNYLRAWREYRGLTQAKLADAVGTTGAVISLLESGERGLSDKWLRKLAPVLETTMGYLLEVDPKDADLQVLSLRAGLNAIVVTPESGAAVLGWRRGGTPMLRHALPAAAVAGDPHAMGWFPLVPYCNRIGFARFHWQGRPYQVARNFGDSPHAIHGVGWRRAWTIEDAADDRATLHLWHDSGPAWPFAFEAAIGYRVTEAGVEVTMAVTNRHDSDAPAGLGLHPFFPKAHNPALQFHARAAWDNAPDALPLREVALPQAWDHATPRPVAASRLDNCFTGWDRRAAISAGPASLDIEAEEAFGNVQVFTPSWADFFCVEPVTHVPDAINRPDLPAGQAMHVLAPHQTLRGTIRLTVR